MEYDLSDALSDDEACEEKSHKKKCSKSYIKKQNREVIVATSDKYTETLVITQKLEVKKQENTCVINLNTSICENEMKLESCKNLNNSERIVPRCCRVRCRSSICGKSDNKTYRRHRKRSTHTTSKNGISTLKTYYTNSRKTKQSQTKKKKSKSSMKCVRKPSLSSISSLSSDTTEHQISYEDVSLDSFTCYSDSELDTLIKRTKEREKEFSLSSKFLCDQPLCSSTPLPSLIDISSDDKTQDAWQDNSIHSKTTLVLEPQVDNLNYSPVTKHCYKDESLEFLDEEVPEDKDTKIKRKYSIDTVLNPNFYVNDDDFHKINNNNIFFG